MKKLIVVTGGTKGIGKSIIRLFAARGFEIATCSRNRGELEMLHREITGQYPGTLLHYRQADLSRREETDAFAAFVKGLETPVEVLVNNAGLYLPGQIHTEEDGVLEQMININLYSAYHLTRALVPGMKQRRSGHIFSLCSTASIIPYVNGGSYCISKFALLGMTKVLREEMKEHGIKVTSVLPGATFTASWEGTELPEERFMAPEDVADAVWTAYNMSPRSVVEEILIRPQSGDL